MKTYKYVIVLFYALSTMIACEPEEDIIPKNEGKKTSTPLDLTVNKQVSEGETGEEFSFELNWSGIIHKGKGFIVEKSVGDSTHWEEVAKLDKGITSFKDTDTKEGSVFFYRVQMIDNNQISAFSRTITITKNSINAPTNLTAEASTSSLITLTWEDNSGNETGFGIQRSLNRRNWEQIATTEADVEFYNDLNLESNTRYFYRVLAFVGRSLYGTNTSDPSNIADDTTFPETPSNVSAEVINSSQITLTWDYVTDNGIDIVIERSLNGTTWQQVANVPSSTRTFTNDYLSSSTEYHYRLYAESNVHRSAFSNTVTAITDAPCLEPGTVHGQNFAFNKNCELVNVRIIGNLTVTNGTLRLINCDIMGNIMQFGDGDIEVLTDASLDGSPTVIKGNIQEYGDGNVSINNSKIIGHIEESGFGELSVKNESQVGDMQLFGSTYVINELDHGDIIIENSTIWAHVGEKGTGSISMLDNVHSVGDIGEQNGGDIIIRDSNVSGYNFGEQSDGNIIIENSYVSWGGINLIHNNDAKIGEQGDGYIYISESSVGANLTENGTGNIDIRNDSNIGGSNLIKNVAEADGGNVYLRDTSIISGNLAESGTGNVFLDDPSNVHGNVASN